MKIVLLLALLSVSALGWKSYAPTEGPFGHMTDDEFAAAYLMPADEAPNGMPPTFNSEAFGQECPIADAFSWRDVSDCVHPIRNQGKCGSCWAHATTEVLSDRYCLATNDTELVFAPQYMVDCANTTWEAEGCDGAETQTILSWMEEFGAVTESCYPYYSGDTESAGTCRSNCSSDEEWSLYSASDHKLFFNYTNCEIAQEIEAHGPIYFSMVVFSDFKQYEGGVYHPIDYTVLGTHAVKCYGWGYDAENLSYYWNCANSWDTTWGEEGHFRIGFNDFIGYKAGSISYSASNWYTPVRDVKSILTE